MSELQEHPHCGRELPNGGVCEGKMIPFDRVEGGRLLRQCSSAQCLRTLAETVPENDASGFVPEPPFRAIHEADVPLPLGNGGLS